MNRTNSFVTGYNNNSSYKKVDVVFPYGTAIFNARAHEEMRSMVTAQGAYISNGVYFSGRQFYGDTLHLNEGLPCYIAALAVAQKLFSIVTNYEGQSVTGNEILPAVSGVYPSGTEWKAWSESALVRNANGLNAIYGIDGENGAKVRDGVIGSISRQWAVWFANQAVANPYALVGARVDGGSTDVSITVNATHCSVLTGNAQKPGGAIPSSLAFHDSLWVYVIPDDGYSISDLFWTVDWRVDEGSVEDFKAYSFADYTYDGTAYKRYQFQSLRENIVINATATQTS